MYSLCTLIMCVNGAEKSPVLTPFSLRACVQMHTHTRSLLIHIESPNPQISGSGFATVVMFLVVCLWGPSVALLGWSLCWSRDLRASGEMVAHSVCLSALLAAWWWYRCGEGTTPQSHCTQESDYDNYPTLRISLCYPSFFQIFSTITTITELVTELGGKGSAVMWESFHFSPSVCADSKLSKTNETSLRLMMLRRGEKPSAQFCLSNSPVFIHHLRFHWRHTATELSGIEIAPGNHPESMKSR